MNRDQLIENIQRYGLKAGEAMEVVNMIDKYIDENTKSIKVKATYNFANLVAEMRSAQRQKLSGQKNLESKIDKTIIQIQKHYKLIAE